MGNPDSSGKILFKSSKNKVYINREFIFLELETKTAVFEWKGYTSMTLIFTLSTFRHSKTTHSGVLIHWYITHTDISFFVNKNHDLFCVVLLKINS